jgi:hypothetical protein
MNFCNGVVFINDPGRSNPSYLGNNIFNLSADQIALLVNGAVPFPVQADRLASLPMTGIFFILILLKGFVFLVERKIFLSLRALFWKKRRFLCREGSFRGRICK